MFQPATKVVIVTEKLILDQVVAIIDAAGATGYTAVAAGGKGSRGIRSTSRASVVDAFANVRIEVITTDRDVASRIVEEVVERYFSTYSGIAYLEPVEILRPEKFRGHRFEPPGS